MIATISIVLVVAAGGYFIYRSMKAKRTPVVIPSNNWASNIENNYRASETAKREAVAADKVREERSPLQVETIKRHYSDSDIAKTLEHGEQQREESNRSKLKKSSVKKTPVKTTTSTTTRRRDDDDYYSSGSSGGFIGGGGFSDSSSSWDSDRSSSFDSGGFSSGGGDFGGGGAGGDW